MTENNKAGGRPKNEIQGIRTKTPTQTNPTHRLPMKSESQETEKKLDDDLKTFEGLPAKTQELHFLADESEKSTGKRRADIDQKIKPQS